MEYGIVKHRFRLANPELFTKHVEQSGHVVLGRRHNLGSASRDRFAKALHRLADKGELVKKMGRGTGAWEHNLYDTYRQAWMLVVAARSARSITGPVHPV